MAKKGESPPPWKPSEGAQRHELTLVRTNGNRYSSAVWVHPDRGWGEGAIRNYLINSIRFYHLEEDGDRFE